MEFKNIEDIKMMVEYLKECYGENSKWYEDLCWFSSNNYTTTSEYFGEMLLFIEHLMEDEDTENQRCDLEQLKKALKVHFI